MRVQAAFERRHLDNAVRKVRTHGDRLEAQFGFVADPNLRIWDNVERCLGKMDVMQMQSRPRNVACHNLLRNNEIPTGTPQLLGLGLNYCVKPTSTREMTTHTFSRLAKDLRRMYALRNADEEGNYIPELYLKSDFEFKDASQRIEQGLCNFKLAVRRKLLLLRQRRHLKPQLNLSPLSFNLMQYLKNHDHLIVVQGDKNLGPCILDRTFYIFKGFSEHLGNTRNYKELTVKWAHCRQRGLQYQFRNWLSKYKPKAQGRTHRLRHD